MPDLIEIKGIKSFGYHGVFESENIAGQDFYVDVLLELDLTRASVTDDVADTVNYAEVTDLVLEEITGEPVSLIEIARHGQHEVRPWWEQMRSRHLIQMRW